MKITVLNGSPKGDISVTMQYINYIQRQYNQHELNIINISQRINSIEQDPKVFDDIISEIAASDGVIWAFPLYIFMVAAQYKRFIELIFERHAEAAFKGKYAAILTTSVHLFDHTAINYMNSICDDLAMNYVDFFSLHMFDLEKADIRKNLLLFAQNFFNAIENKKATFKNFSPMKYSPFQYFPETNFDRVDISNKKVVIVTDSFKNENLKNMIEKFSSFFSPGIELINLDDIDIKGGCLGCLRCGYNYECAYTGKDGFIDFYNRTLKTADILIFAGTIHDRYLSSSWKMFFDRGFFNTHTPSLSGKQVGFIISGPLQQIPNLRQIFESYLQWQRSNLVGCVTDESDCNTEIDEQLYSLAHDLIHFSNMNYVKPFTFLGISGWKGLRDEMWGELRFPFVADHKAYKALKVYDFPQKNYKSRIKNTIMIFMSKFSFMRKEIYSNRIKTAMLESLKKVVKNSAM